MDILEATRVLVDAGFTVTLVASATPEVTQPAAAKVVAPQPAAPVVAPQPAPPAPQQKAKLVFGKVSL